MKKNEAGFTLYELIVVIMMVFCLALIPASIYVTGSLITSGIKAGADKCGVQYGIEPWLEGDWFCPED